MKKLFLGMVGALLLGSAVACGGDACDDLKAQCDKCTEMMAKDACNAVHTTASALPTSDVACQAHLDAKTYENCGG